jgi:hypothetical protein
MESCASTPKAPHSNSSLPAKVEPVSIDDKGSQEHHEPTESQSPPMLIDSQRPKMDEGKGVDDLWTPLVLADTLHPPQTGEGCGEVSALLVEETAAPRTIPILTDALHPPQLVEGCRVSVNLLVEEVASPVTLMSSRLRRKLGLIDKPPLQTNHKLRNAQRSAVVANLAFGDFNRDAVALISSRLRRKLGLIDKPILDTIELQQAPGSTVMVDVGFSAWKMVSIAARTGEQSALRIQGQRRARRPA